MDFRKAPFAEGEPNFPHYLATADSKHQIFKKLEWNLLSFYFLFLVNHGPSRPVWGISSGAPYLDASHGILFLRQRVSYYHQAITAVEGEVRAEEVVEESRG